jgi:signal peptidase I
MKKLVLIIKNHIGLVKVIGFLCGIAIFVTLFIKCILSPIVVVGDSMYPALEAKDIIVVNTIGNNFRNINRFDIVVFPYKYDNSVTYIKRVIGMPGDTIKIVDDVIYIDDKPLEEFYGYYDNSIESKYTNMSEITLSVDEYFVMGDNRNISIDSRSEDVGIVNRDDILGVAIFRVWPFNSIGSLKYQ